MPFAKDEEKIVLRWPKQNNEDQTFTISEAIESIGFGRFQWRCLSVIGFILVNVYE
ncbi:hypothetical protein TrispH2_010090 [Trichoplax sp. H2]|nr:hypothetical protein TrispH2_010090 [Trichoplax sp. H2]|eukprot:RDD39086.1 hypothetical protein TrispH2_010090 [Trichoplax sp. H2]